ncbi:zinc finger protein 431-like [Anopheles cruzii]|uniref:zinc finger protein 431-like n=1 Tax=Anopheles cruzii TaxID=68878 RepID=UPI0022EC4509|nr:zinc finger protein 431-like [Anopheles cruzii]
METLESLVSRFDFLCRFCLADVGCVPIFLQDGVLNENVQKAFDIILTKVDEHDGLPNNVCTDCLLRMENIVDFEANCSRSYKILEKVACFLEQRNANQEMDECAQVPENAKRSTDGEGQFDAIEEYIEDQDDEPDLKHGSDSETQSVVMLQLEIVGNERSESSCEEITEEQELVTEENVHDTENREDEPHFDCTDGLQNMLPPDERKLYFQAAQNKEHKYIIRGKRKVPVIECIFCNKMYRGRNTLRKHLRIHFQLKSYVCHLCDPPTRFTDRSSLRVHEVRHAETKAFKCDQCERSYFTNNELKQHYTMRHEERKYVCQVCSARFASNAILKDHSRVHTSDRPFVCNVCGMCFKRNRNLVRHMDNKHSAKATDKQAKQDNFSLITCYWCTAVFELPSKLLAHITEEHGQECEEMRLKSHFCPTCSKKFTTLDECLLHQDKHTLFKVQNDGITMHQCGACGKQLRYRSLAKKHLLSHTKTRVYQCHYAHCSRKYKHKMHFARHMRVVHQKLEPPK